MSEKQAQINVKLAQSTLEKWDRHIQELGFSSRAEFVRFAVNNEIAGRHESSEPTHDIDNSQIESVNDSVNELTKQMTQMQEQIQTLQSAVRSDPETEQLADNIFSLLPDCKPGTEAWQQEKLGLEKEAQADTEGAKERYKAWQGTPEALSEALDAPLRKIHVALDKLIAETHLIESEETDDSTIYWKEV